MGGVPKKGGACESMRLSPCVLVQPDGWARGEREGYGEPCDVTIRATVVFARRDFSSWKTCVSPRPIASFLARRRWLCNAVSSSRGVSHSFCAPSGSSIRPVARSMVDVLSVQLRLSLALTLWCWKIWASGSKTLARQARPDSKRHTAINISQAFDWTQLSRCLVHLCAAAAFIEPPD